MTKRKILKNPESAAVLSLLAVLLVCAMPAGVALIDSGASIDMDTPKEYDETTLFSTITMVKLNGVATDTPLTPFLFPSESGFGYMWAIGVPADSTATVHLRFNDYSSVFDAEKIVMHVNDPGISGIAVRLSGAVSFPLAETSEGIWEYQFSAVDRLKMKGMTGNPWPLMSIVWADTPDDGFVDVSIELFEGSTSIYYASFVAGIAGLLLFLCAIFASPWVQVGTFSRMVNKAKGKLKGRRK